MNKKGWLNAVIYKKNSPQEAIKIYNFKLNFKKT